MAHQLRPADEWPASAASAAAAEHQHLPYHAALACVSTDTFAPCCWTKAYGLYFPAYPRVGRMDDYLTLDVAVCPEHMVGFLMQHAGGPLQEAPLKEGSL